ncbi:Polyketide synthase-nonribosomal peptide synthetase [Sesbania bispinosa]|nr:Polyketide synthase-nonribosomal peptide synthetase [Sesbania bispinosa]
MSAMEREHPLKEVVAHEREDAPEGRLSGKWKGEREIERGGRRMGRCGRDHKKMVALGEGTELVRRWFYDGA